MTAWNRHAVRAALVSTIFGARDCYCGHRTCNAASAGRITPALHHFNRHPVGCLRGVQVPDRQVSISFARTNGRVSPLDKPEQSGKRRCLPVSPRLARGHLRKLSSVKLPGNRGVMPEAGRYGERNNQRFLLTGQPSTISSKQRWLMNKSS